MQKLIYYSKLTSIFVIIELMVTFIISLLNLLGLNSGITSIIMLISNILIFFILSYINAYNMKKKGVIQGIILGTVFILLMIIIKLILFNSGFGISTLIYYIILFISSIIGGMFGVNKKSDK